MDEAIVYTTTVVMVKEDTAIAQGMSREFDLWKQSAINVPLGEGYKSRLYQLLSVRHRGRLFTLYGGAFVAELVRHVESNRRPTSYRPTKVVKYNRKDFVVTPTTISIPGFLNDFQVVGDTDYGEVSEVILDLSDVCVTEGEYRVFLTSKDSPQYGASYVALGNILATHLLPDVYELFHKDWLSSFYKSKSLRGDISKPLTAPHLITYKSASNAELTMRNRMLKEAVANVVQYHSHVIINTDISGGIFDLPILQYSWPYVLKRLRRYITNKRYVGKTNIQRVVILNPKVTYSRVCGLCRTLHPKDVSVYWTCGCCGVEHHASTNLRDVLLHIGTYELDNSVESLVLVTTTQNEYVTSGLIRARA